MRGLLSIHSSSLPGVRGRISACRERNADSTFSKEKIRNIRLGRLDGLFCFRKSADRSAGFLLMERQMDMQFRESLLSQIASEYRGGLPVIFQKQFRDLVIGSQYQIARELISLPDSHRLSLE